MGPARSHIIKIRGLCLITLALLLFPTCKKNTPPVQEPVSVTAVVFGNTDGLQVKSTSTTQVDVDGDGLNDLELKSESVKNGPGPMWATVRTLICLHSEISLRSVTRSDTIFTQTTITLSQLLYDDTLRNWKEKKVSYTCSRLEGSSVHTVTLARHFLGFKAGQKADLTQEFSTGEVVVLRPGTHYGSYSNPRIDTVQSYSYSYNEDCKADLNSSEPYFCFKRVKMDKVRIGWIKTTGSTFTEVAISP